MLIIVRLTTFDAVTRCQGCGEQSFDIRDANGWRWAFACTGCGRIKHATQEEPKYEDGNLIVSPLGDEERRPR